MFYSCIIWSSKKTENKLNFKKWFSHTTKYYITVKKINFISFIDFKGCPHVKCKHPPTHTHRDDLVRTNLEN